MSALKLSPQGGRFLLAWEGFRPECYDDGGIPGKGNCTIGIGHLVHLGPTTQADRQKWGSLSLASALHLLYVDVQRNCIEPLRASLRVSLTTGQVDALCSLAFNCGPGSLASGHVVMNAVNSKPHRWQLVAMRQWHARVQTAMLEWAVPPELRRRRLSEARLFATGKYTRASGNGYANG